MGGEDLGSPFLGDTAPRAQPSPGSAPDEAPLPLEAQRWQHLLTADRQGCFSVFYGFLKTVHF